MDLSQALQWLTVLEIHGTNFHYLSCGIYNQGLITTIKFVRDPSYKCTCGRDEAVRIVSRSRVGLLIWRQVGANIAAEKVAKRKARLVKTAVKRSTGTASGG